LKETYEPSHVSLNSVPPKGYCCNIYF